MEGEQPQPEQTITPSVVQQPEEKQKKGYRTTLLNRSKIKEYLQNKGVHPSNDYCDAVEKKLTTLIDESIERAMTNNRRTVLSRDA